MIYEFRPAYLSGLLSRPGGEGPVVRADYYTTAKEFCYEEYMVWNEDQSHY